MGSWEHVVVGVFEFSNHQDHFNLSILAVVLVVMLSQRKRSLSAKLGASKKSTSPLKRRPPAPKKEWDSFQNDPSRYKLTKEEELRKKQLLVSKHNIMTDTVQMGGGSYVSRIQKGPVRAPVTIAVAGSVAETTEKVHTEVDALDLLGSDKEDHHTTPVTSKKKRALSTTKKTTKSATKENARPDDKAASRKSPTAPSNSNSKLRRNLDREYEVSEASSCDEDEEVVNERSARTPSPSHKHRVGGGGNFASSSGTKRASPTPRSAPGSASRSAPASAEKDYDLVYVADEVRSLFSELKYYEELSGRRSILDTREELEAMLRDEALLDPAAHKPVMRSLVQLVCQSMTYLLKSEVDLQDQRKHYEQLHAKYETLNTLLAPGSGVPNVSDFALPTTTRDADAASAAAGIAFREDDIYPLASHWRHTVSDSAMSLGQVESVMSVELANQRQVGSASTESSSALRRLAQQYAQDDLYPVPADADEGAALTESAMPAMGARSTAHLMSPQVLAAKFASTPARFQELVGSVGAQETKAAKLASNLPPGMGVQTPQRHDAASAKLNPYNSVSSTCSTPPVGLLHKKFNVMGGASTPAELYPYITTPAPYVDAYASFMPSSRKAPAGQRPMDATGVSTPMSGTSRVPERPHHETRPSATGEQADISSFIGADLTRVDELLAYSKRISTAPLMSFTPGGEFSTISRLADTFAGAGRTPADESMISGAAMNASALDASYMSAQRTQREQDQYKHLYESQDSVMSLPPPPPPSSSVSAQRPAITPVRQPVAATASRDQILRVPTDTDGLGASLTALPGTSTSDWLFGAYPAMHQTAATAAQTTSAPSTGMRTPTRDARVQAPQPQGAAHDAARKQHHSPATTELYRGGEYSAAVSTSQGSPRDATVDRLTQQLHSALELTAAPTPAPQAPAPSYLLQPVTQDAVTPELYPSSRSQQSAVVSKVRPSSIPVKQGIVQVKKTVSVSATAKNLRSPKSPALAEQPTIIVPHQSAPSPHSAPVHPFAQKQAQYAASSSSPRALFSNSNESTPIARVEARPLPGRIFDARIGSF